MFDPKKKMAWDALQVHQKHLAETHLAELFKADTNRFHSFSCETAGLFFDYSKQHVTDTTKKLWVDLLEASGLASHREALFSGAVVNVSESRGAWHVGLRDLNNHWDLAFYGDVHQSLQKIERLSSLLHSGQLLGFSGQPIKKIIHIGIGGSEYGPKLLCEAFSPQIKTNLSVEFLSSETQSAVEAILSTSDPSETLFIAASKSFSTAETVSIARHCYDWLINAGQQKAREQFFAVTANASAAQEFGVLADLVLPLWDAIGGRFSATSSVSLVFALLVGFDGFKAFLEGAHAMDHHFKETDYLENLPVLHAFSTIWYAHFWGHDARVLLPYQKSFKQLVPFVQQLSMESLGKRVDSAGAELAQLCGPMIWGGVGSNTQHTFHQFLFQGNRSIAVDFVLPVGDQFHMKNCLAQSQALMQGSEAALTTHQRILGNVPSTTLLLDPLSPETLGALLAFYEHSVFVQSVLLGINAFDQWGVELGKKMAKALTQVARTDASTQGLLRRILSHERA